MGQYGPFAVGRLLIWCKSINGPITHFHRDLLPYQWHSCTLEWHRLFKSWCVFPYYTSVTGQKWAKILPCFYINPDGLKYDLPTDELYSDCYLVIAAGCGALTTLGIHTCHVVLNLGTCYNALDLVCIAMRFLFVLSRLWGCFASTHTLTRLSGSFNPSTMFSDNILWKVFVSFPSSVTVAVLGGWMDDWVSVVFLRSVLQRCSMALKRNYTTPRLCLLKKNMTEQYLVDHKEWSIVSACESSARTQWTQQLQQWGEIEFHWNEDLGSAAAIVAQRNQVAPVESWPMF